MRNDNINGDYFTYLYSSLYETPSSTPSTTMLSSLGNSQNSVEALSDPTPYNKIRLEKT